MPLWFVGGERHYRCKSGARGHDDAIMRLERFLKFTPPRRDPSRRWQRRGARFTFSICRIDKFPSLLYSAWPPRRQEWDDSQSREHHAAMYFSTSAIDDAITSVVIPPPPSTAISLVSYDAGILHMDGKSELQRWSSLIGIITAIVGNILISFALNIQRYAHIKLHEEKQRRKERLRNIGKGVQNGYGTNGTNGSNGHVQELNGSDGTDEDNTLQSSYHSDRSRSSCDSEHSERSDNDGNQDSSYLRSPYWWGGIVLMTIGEAGNFLAYGFAPASIVSPLGVVALISNCVIAPVMLKERFRMRDFWGVVVAVCGAVVVVLSAKGEEKKLGPHEIWGAITNTEFEIYMAITATLIAILLWASPKYGNKTILIDLGLVGLFGGYTALSTKGVASMLSSTLWRALTTPVTYGLVAVLVGTAIMQVKYVNRALQRFDSTQVIPIQFVMFTLSVIIGSAILYRDFEKATAESFSKFIGGCLLTFFGVFLITSGRPPREDNDDEGDSDEEGEERIILNEQNGTAEENHDKHKEYQSVKTTPRYRDDGTVDEDEIRDSRRSSRVSFADQARPKTPQINLSSTYQPPGRSVPSIMQSEAVKPEDSPLLNPWKTPTDDLQRNARHPGLQSAMSTPHLPAEAQTSSDTLKPPAPPISRTTSQGNVHTHPNLQTSPQPPQGDRSERPMTPARHSISRMMPGPLLSPLSGGLSAVVADSLLRGVDAPRSKSLRRPRLGLRRSKSGSQRISRLYTDGDDEEALLGSSPSPAAEGVRTDGSNEWSRITRARSLSNTLGDLFRNSKRQKSDTGEDDDAGPSDSRQS